MNTHYTHTLKVPHYSHVADRTLPVGTPLQILAKRPADRSVLVKAKGASWPLSMSYDNVEPQL